MHYRIQTHSWAIGGWDWSTVTEIYKRLERFKPDDPTSDVPDFHGAYGPITTSRPFYVDEIAPEFVSSAVHVGIKFTDDFNAPGGREGVGYYHFNIAGGTRDSAAKSMLADVMFGKRSNLRVELGAEVHRVLLEPTSAAGLVETVEPVSRLDRQQQQQQQQMQRVDRSPADSSPTTRVVLSGVAENRATDSNSTNVNHTEGVGTRSRMRAEEEEDRKGSEGVDKNRNSWIWTRSWSSWSGWAGGCWWMGVGSRGDSTRWQRRLLSYLASDSTGT